MKKKRKDYKTKTECIKPECTRCENCWAILSKGGAFTIHEDGTKSPCDECFFICKLDKKYKGVTFYPFEELEPDECPLAVQKKSWIKRLLSKFFI